MRVADLAEHPKNPRKHPDRGGEAWEALKKSLAADYFDPLVVNIRNGFLVSGHLRRKVLEEMGVEEVDVVVVDYDEPQHLARMAAANRQFGEWDDEALSALAREVNEAGLGSWMAGFLEEDWSAMVDLPPDEVTETSDPEELVSKAEELQKKWNVQPGEIFTFGRQRLLCGDSTQKETWDRLLGGRSVDLVWTDPPYNVDYGSLQDMRNSVNRKRGRKASQKPEHIANDHMDGDGYRRLIRSVMDLGLELSKPGAAIYVAHADLFGGMIRHELEASGWFLKQCIIWVKNCFTLGRQDYQWQHEPILYGWKPGAAHFWQGWYGQTTVHDEERIEEMTEQELRQFCRSLCNERRTTVAREPRNTETFGHPTIKPLDLVTRQIWNSSKKGEMVIDFFGGSGTTLMAAEVTGRSGAAADIDPKFCAVILERFEQAGFSIHREFALPDA